MAGCLGVALLSAPLVELPLTSRFDRPMLNYGKSVALQSSRRQTFEMRAQGSVLSDIVLDKKTLKRSYTTNVIIQ